MARRIDASARETALGQRLRALRETEFRRLTQEEVAQALGQPALSVATISMWEGSGRTPPRARLEAYARLFCTRRSFADREPHLLDEADLSKDERARMQELERELLGLRATALADAGQDEWSIWRFPDNRPVTLVCSELPKELRSEYANPGHRDFVRAYSWADVDALIGLHGHIRAENPTSAVEIKGGELDPESPMQGHLVLIGGVLWNRATKWFLRRLSLPVQQRPTKGNIFVTEDDGVREFGPVWGDDGGGANQADDELRVPEEDVGLFARTANPLAPQCSLSICNGVTTRGVRGAVLAFTNPEFRERNERYVLSRFGRDASFCILMRVPIYDRGDHDPITPDLTDENTVLYEWSEVRNE
ncbi:MAG TPA: helix-turn-helix transcriptional regulator [Actinomycetes bacterium]|jgi:transcriptional regulator with XRE-family HTH domain|nr:helix-turn-helix transcriptional regulator [Actinomycetes bacterium]